ncbi:MAG: hypothetical protein KY442_08695 [Proteobacteria bacterium]|nr:hypothetical protein [Pseudomonadota bacterium]
MSDDDVACMPVGQCRQLLVELQAVRLRVTALEQAVADYVRAADDAGQGPGGAGS